MGGYIGARAGSLSTTTVANVQDVTATDTTPEVTIINNTHEDTDGGREGKVIFKGQQSGGEESTLAEIQASHDGTADDEKGDLIFRTNDGSDGASPTEAMRITSQQRVGIGDVDPIAPLHISSGNSGASASVHSDELFIEGSASSGITIGSATTGYGNLRFADSGGTDQGIVQYNHSTDMMRFVTDGSVRMTIDSGGHAAFTLGTNALGTFTDGVGEVGSGNFCLQVSNDAGSALKPLGFRAEDIRFATGSSERMKIASDGTVFVGTSLSFGGKVNVHEGGIGVGESASSGYYRRMYWNAANNEMRFWNGTNEARITDGGVFTNASDISLKKDIADIEYGIDTVKSLQPRKYKMKSDDKEQVGFIAQEMESHVPEIVSVGVTPDGDEHKGIAYGQLTAVLTKALQEAIAKIETLETKVAALEAE